jgi:AraC family transcriptional regulator of adaptative response/methylated-DNA-[protein]-cysteine methyltransferase
MNDYERIATLIRYIDLHRAEQPSLEVLAAEAGLSSFHFHRLFSAWAGVTPKDFLQCLSLAHARALLRDGETVLDAAYAAGLSGPGRLHDLSVSLDAATPGEIKSGGEGWTLSAGFAQTPFGECLIAMAPRGVCHLSFLEEGMGHDEALQALREEWPRADLHRDDAAARDMAAMMFVAPAAGVREIPVRSTQGRVNQPGAPTLRVLVRGSAFQVRVWRALLAIPSGALVSYGGLARALGSPSAARAVGSAVAKNAIAYLIPCHRVIRETGVVGEYRWGHERKRAMLAWEGSRPAAERASAVL